MSYSKAILAPHTATFPRNFGLVNKSAKHYWTSKRIVFGLLAVYVAALLLVLPALLVALLF